MGAPSARQRRIQGRDGGPIAGLLAQHAGQPGQRITQMRGLIGDRIGQQRLDLTEYSPGQVAGDRGGLGIGVAQIEDKAGRATLLVVVQRSPPCAIRPRLPSLPRRSCPPRR
jgi:hypothetical protein